MSDRRQFRRPVQPVSRVRGEAESAGTELMRKRPSGATSYWKRTNWETTIRVWNSTRGACEGFVRGEAAEHLKQGRSVPGTALERTLQLRFEPVDSDRHASSLGDPPWDPADRVIKANRIRTRGAQRQRASRIKPVFPSLTRQAASTASA